MFMLIVKYILGTQGPYRKFSKFELFLIISINWWLGFKMVVYEKIYFEA